MLPLEIEEYNEVYSLYHSELHWKINHHMDGIANNRAAVAERELAN